MQIDTSVKLRVLSEGKGFALEPSRSMMPLHPQYTRR